MDIDSFLRRAFVAAPGPSGLDHLEFGRDPLHPENFVQPSEDDDDFDVYYDCLEHLPPIAPLSGSKDSGVPNTIFDYCEDLDHTHQKFRYVSSQPLQDEDGDWFIHCAHARPLPGCSLPHLEDHICTCDQAHLEDHVCYCERNHLDDHECSRCPLEHVKEETQFQRIRENCDDLTAKRIANFFSGSAVPPFIKEGWIWMYKKDDTWTKVCPCDQ